MLAINTKIFIRRLIAKLQNRAYNSSFLYQIATIGAQGAFFLLFYFHYGVVGLDGVFLCLAYLVPIYVFSLLGGRQLYFSDKITARQFVNNRSVATLGYVLVCLCFLSLSPQGVDGSILIAVASWKVFDLTIDLVSALSQKREMYKAFDTISVGRVAVFIPAFLMPAGLSHTFLIGELLIISAILNGYVILKSRREISRNNLSVRHRFLKLGIVASISALLVSVPRVYLGNSASVAPGMLSFIGLFSYTYIICQIIISAVIPIKLIELGKRIGGDPIRRGIGSVLVRCGMTFGFALGIVYVSGVADDHPARDPTVFRSRATDARIHISWFVGQRGRALLESDKQ